MEKMRQICELHILMIFEVFSFFLGLSLRYLVSEMFKIVLFYIYIVIQTTNGRYVNEWERHIAK